MKKFMKRNSFLAVMFFACASLVFASCSKDKDEAPASGIDEAVGTYVGTLEIFGSTKEHYNAEITVTKVDGSNLKIVAKAGEEYSGVAAKTMKVERNYNVSINTLLEPNGDFMYSIADKTVLILTKKTQEGEITYTFNGKKK